MPYKHKVTGSNPVPATIETAGQTFSSDLFLFQGNQGLIGQKRVWNFDPSAPECGLRLMRRKPDSLPINQKGRRLSRRPSSCAISIWQPGKPRSDTTRLHGASAPFLIPLARPSRRRASRAHGQAMPPWHRRRAYGRSRRAARRRTAVADRSGASRRRRLSW